MAKEQGRSFDSRHITRRVNRSGWRAGVAVPLTWLTKRDHKGRGYKVVVGPTLEGAFVWFG
jgi:hypothetical protein